MLRKNLDYLASALYEAGIRHWVVSPGSRNAPIVAGLSKHGGFTLYSFPDERAAAYAALGMSQASHYPCGVVCTSGTAVLNLYPAVCEAYYQRIPLLVLTADRPPEWIDQWDGQTIHQTDIFEKHILFSGEISDETDSKDCSENILETVYTAVKSSLENDKGPVHINVPLREPIYQDIDTPFNKVQDIKPFVFPKNPVDKPDAAFLRAEIEKHLHILILVGQMPPDDYIQAAIKTLATEYPVLADVTAGNGYQELKLWDRALLNQPPPKTLKPDLIISFGKSFISKKLKQFLRENPPTEQWHISEGGFTGNPFQTDLKIIETGTAEFLDTLTDVPYNHPRYRNEWKLYIENHSGKPALKEPFFTEYSAVQSVVNQMSETDVLHAGNSMAARYVSWTGGHGGKVFINRGTSGIDGSLSTAVGYALANPDETVICILGDLSFFYDSHGLWTDNIPKNLGIVVINNGGGKIFNFIDGPGKVEAIQHLIYTPHRRSVKLIAEDYGIPYYPISRNENASRPATPFILEFDLK